MVDTRARKRSIRRYNGDMMECVFNLDLGEFLDGQPWRRHQSAFIVSAVEVFRDRFRRNRYEDPYRRFNFPQSVEQTNRTSRIGGVDQIILQSILVSTCMLSSVAYARHPDDRNGICYQLPSYIKVRRVRYLRSASYVLIGIFALGR